MKQPKFIFIVNTELSHVGGCVYNLKDTIFNHTMEQYICELSQGVGRFETIDHPLIEAAAVHIISCSYNKNVDYIEYLVGALKDGAVEEYFKSQESTAVSIIVISPENDNAVRLRSYTKETYTSPLPNYADGRLLEVLLTFCCAIRMVDRKVDINAESCIPDELSIIWQNIPQRLKSY